MSLRYDVAVALIDGNVLIDQFTEARIADPVVCDLASRIEVEVDPEMDAIYPERFAGIVTIVLDGGRQFRKRVDFSKGTPENPMSADELSAKFRSLAGAAVGAESADRLLEELANIFNISSINGIARDLGALHLKQV
jgi:2-methylcitrate dehydratase PrpD